MNMTVEFKFASLVRVWIPEISSSGLVTSRMNNAEGLNEYKVQFWLESKRMSEWFFEQELAEMPR